MYYRVPVDLYLEVLDDKEQTKKLLYNHFKNRLSNINDLASLVFIITNSIRYGNLCDHKKNKKYVFMTVDFIIESKKDEDINDVIEKIKKYFGTFKSITDYEQNTNRIINLEYYIKINTFAIKEWGESIGNSKYIRDTLKI